jgi:hypothetical protein
MTILSGETMVVHSQMPSLLLWSLVVDELLTGLNRGSYYAVGCADDTAYPYKGEIS